VSSRVLIVDDEKEMCAVIEQGLRRLGYTTASRLTADAAWELLADEDFDAVVTDLNMRGMNGLELCDRVVTNRNDLPVIVVTGFGNLETAIATMRAGAFDFLQKPFDMDQLVLSVERAVQHRKLRDEVRRLRREVAEVRQTGELIGESAAMRAVHDMVDRVAVSDATVLITGESGSGKEVVARAIHQRSRRNAGPLVAINCAAMPEALLESELFGHVKGAFTDARSARRGLFLEASGGTLLLDELGEMPLGMQAKLLRALEERTVRPVGGNSEVPFDARIVTAVAEKRFREDLYYRVNVVHVEIPPLRQRGGDVLVLAQAFLLKFAKKHEKRVQSLSPEVAQRLLVYAWPGNVRELQNCIERAVALARFEELVMDDLPPKVREYRSAHVVVASDDPSDLPTMEEVERRYVQRVMDAVVGNKTTAAKVLGFDRTTLYRKLEKYGIEALPAGRDD
jgi:DNA-binding NtrC family response regulator